MQAARRRDCQPATEPLAEETYGRDHSPLAEPPHPPPARPLGVTYRPVDQDADVADLPGQPDPPFGLGGLEVGRNHQPDHEPRAGSTRTPDGDTEEPGPSDFVPPCGSLARIDRQDCDPRRDRGGHRPDLVSSIQRGDPRGHCQPRDQRDSRHIAPTEPRGQGVHTRVVGRIGRRNRFVSDPAIHPIAPVEPLKWPRGHGPDFNESEPESRQCLDSDGLDIYPAPEPDWRRELQALEGSRQPRVGAHVTKEIDHEPADG